MASGNSEASNSFFQIQYYKLASYALVFATYILVLLGGWVTATDARDECSDWPFCGGEIFPTDASDKIWAIYIHQLWTVIVVLIILFIAVSGWINKDGYPRLMQLGIGLLLVVVLQVLAGGVSILTDLEEVAVVTHLGLGTALFGLSVLNAAVCIQKT
ncbi:MAG: hypothetical protein ACXACI_05530 [Candidatus Hodarchaeales archaeon]